MEPSIKLIIEFLDKQLLGDRGGSTQFKVVPPSGYTLVHESSSHFQFKVVIQLHVSQGISNTLQPILSYYGIDCP